MDRRPGWITFANVTSLAALVVAMSGGAYALSLGKGDVKAKHIAKNAVGSKQIKKVKRNDLTKQVVNAKKLADGAVSSSKLASGAVDTEGLANAAVTVEKLADGAVDGAKVAANALGAAQVDIPSLGLLPATALISGVADGTSGTKETILSFTNPPVDLKTDGNPDNDLHFSCVSRDGVDSTINRGAVGAFCGAATVSAAGDFETNLLIFRSATNQVALAECGLNVFSGEIACLGLQVP